MPKSAQVELLKTVEDLRSQPRLGLSSRVAILAALCVIEKIALNHFVDFDLAQAAQGFGGFLRDAQHLGFRGLVAFAAALALFAYVRGGAALAAADAEMRAAPIRISWLAGHLGALICLAPLSFLLYRNESVSIPLGGIVAAWLVVAAVGACCAVAALGPLAVWKRAAQALGILWVYAGMAALVSAAVLQLSQRMWGTTATLTFELVRWVLTPVLPDLVSDPATRLLQTPRFGIEVANICSGLEGVGMVLAFTGAWLAYFRREYVFPRALIIVPIGVATIFALNVVRLAMLVLIGNAGFHDVAVYGFHSQAGWIAFICVACGLVLLSRRSAWLYRPARNAPPVAAVVHNPTAVFLMPLLAILAAGAIAHAMSGGFEFFYPLRVLAAAWMLLRYRREIARSLDFGWSWRGVAVGAGVFVVWLVAARLLLTPSAMPARLAEVPAGLRGFWLTFRVVGSVLLVPIAEELAYRGYLMRRIVSEEFEHLPFRAVSLLSLAVTSVVFGLAHGSMWAAGIVAGLAYGVLLMRTGKFGEAVIAHIVSNALVAAAVLIAGQWQLW